MSAAESRVDDLRRAFERGDDLSAIQIAAKFKHPIEPVSRAWAAHQNPDFYRQIGQEPSELLALGVKALRKKYDL
jgi:hypothetical protein